jgi:hypothetical protein
MLVREGKMGSSPDRTRKAVRLGLALLAAYVVFMAWNIHLHKSDYQWDFKAHYYAGRAHAIGESPYDRALLKHLAGSPVDQWYGYPPQAIWIYRFFNLFPYPVAFDVFLAFKILVLAGLLFLWRKHFLAETAGPSFYLFALLAFNQTIYIDFLAGNTSLLEQAGLWAAFYFYLKDRLPAFCVLLVLTANLKFMPIALILLLLLKKDRKKYIYLAGSVVAFFGIQAAALLSSRFSREFLALLVELEDSGGGITGPSTYTFFRQVSRIVLPDIVRPNRILVSKAAFVAAVGGILFLSALAFRRLARSTRPDRDRLAIFLGCLALSLISPRMKDYYFIILIVPAYYLLKTAFKPGGSIPLLIVFCLSVPTTSNLPGLGPVWDLLWSYFPLISAVTIWIVAIRFIFQKS